jgi:hypothetical protein
MTERKSLHTFVGPILKSPQGYTIRIFDAGHPSILTLDYPIKRTAQQARSILMQSVSTHKVPSMELLRAIQACCNIPSPPSEGA